MQPHRWQPTRLCHPWDSPGKNTGVGCHFLLQCLKVKSESEVAQLCLTLCDPMDCSLPGSSVHGIFQARVLEWGAIAFSVLYSSIHKTIFSFKRQKSNWCNMRSIPISLGQGSGVFFTPSNLVIIATTEHSIGSPRQHNKTRKVICYMQILGRKISKCPSLQTI